MTSRGHIVANRYRLDALLGKGGHGEVWTAEDLRLGSEVALKRFDDRSSETLQIRREIATLRRLRLPGVVRLLDEGTDEAGSFLVMDRVVGSHFPGPDMPRPCSWSALGPRALAVIEILAHIHAAGVVHRDLKPENILVDHAGHPILVDFGLSYLAPLGDAHDDDLLIGTPLYAAPEQLRGEAVGPSTDLYAFGVVLYEALAGRPPHDVRGFGQLLAARLSGPPKPLAEVAPDVPPQIAAVIDAMLAIETHDRPASATDVARALAPNPAPLVDGTNRSNRRSFQAMKQALSRDPLASLTEADLASWFGGPDRIFHLPTDAAHILYARARGDPASVLDELDRWEREGLARRDGDLFIVDRESLDYLSLCESSGYTSHHANDDDLAHSAIEIAETLTREGFLGRAIAALAQAQRFLERHGSSAQARCAIVRAWVAAALCDGTPQTLDRVLCEIGRIEAREHLSREEDLVRAALALMAGTDRAFSMVEALGPFQDPRFERARRALLVASARRMAHDKVEALVADADSWAEAMGTLDARAAVLGFRGRLCYQQGRFEDAGDLFARAATIEPNGAAQVAASFHAAAAWMEAFRLDVAIVHAERARALASKHRHTYYEAKAEWLLRTAAYRLGSLNDADLALVDAAAAVGVPDLEALVCMTEASILFRCGDTAGAARLADRARRLWAGMKKLWAERLAHCLWLACEGGSLVDDVPALVSYAEQCNVKGLGVQMLGLLGMVYPEKRSSFLPIAERLSLDVRREHWHIPMDVLSVNESLAAL